MAAFVPPCVAAAGVVGAFPRGQCRLAGGHSRCRRRRRYRAPTARTTPSPGGRRAASPSRYHPPPPPPPPHPPIVSPTLAAAIAGAVPAGTPPVTALSDASLFPGATHTHLRVHTASSGVTYLAKVNTRPGSAAVLAGEAASLNAFRGAPLRVPTPVAVGTVPVDADAGGNGGGSGGGGEDGGAFLLMEWVELMPFGASIPSVQAALGTALARTHAEMTAADGGYGFAVPTYLGATALDNTRSDDWAEFFLRRRLAPALANAIASHGGGVTGTNAQSAAALSRHAAALLADDGAAVRAVVAAGRGGMPPPPSLLHGDLWAGNVGATAAATATAAERQPVAVDPASWYGDAEFDLAVSRLYGALGAPFAAAYAAGAGWGRRGEAAAVVGGRVLRARLYTAYHSLNQLNLHGAGYGREGGGGGGEYERAVRLLGEVVAGARDVM